MLHIGYLRKGKQPGTFAKTLAIESQKKGLKLIYFTPDNVNMEKKTIMGLVYRDGKWYNETVRIPVYIDISPLLFGRKETKNLVSFLGKQSTLSTNMRNPLTRARFPKFFKKKSYFHDHVLLIHQVETIDDVKAKAIKYSLISLKPKKTRTDSPRYIIQYKAEKNQYDLYPPQKIDKKLKNLFAKVEQDIVNSIYTIEKYIPSPDGSLEEADCIVQLEKDGRGDWNIIRMEMKKLEEVSLQSYIEKNFPGTSANLYEDVQKFVLQFIHVIERIRKFKYMSIGLNIVLDVDGKIYVRRVIPNPSVQSVEAVIADLRSDYYNFLAPSLQLTPEEEEQLELIAQENQKIEEEIIQLHKEEESKRKLIEQGLLQEEKPKKAYLTIVGFVFMFFIVLRLAMKIINP